MQISRVDGQTAAFSSVSALPCQTNAAVAITVHPNCDRCPFVELLSAPGGITPPHARRGVFTTKHIWLGDRKQAIETSKRTNRPTNQQTDP